MNEYSFAKTRTDNRWRCSTGTVATGAGVTVAVIDSGWDRSRTDARILQGVGLVDPENDLGMRCTIDDADRIGHGTACTHLLLDLAPDARIVPVRVFGRTLETSPATIEAAIHWAIERRVDIINLSLATLREDARDAFYVACARASAAGIIMVAAVPDSGIGYPSAFDIVLSVGVCDGDNPSVFSYVENDIVECRSPGNARRTVGLHGREVTVSGSSFAAPNISGIVALWLEMSPGLTLADIRLRLAQYARP